MPKLRVQKFIFCLMLVFLLFAADFPIPVLSRSRLALYIGGYELNSVHLSLPPPAHGGDSSHPSISADGRYVVFASDATDLMTGITTDGIFLRDRQTATTTKIPNSDLGSDPVISGDGHVIAYTLKVGSCFDPCTGTIRAYDTQSGQTTTASVNSSGVASNTDGNSTPVISYNGQFVAFVSDATNLVSGDTNNVTDIFLRDRVNNITTRISVDSGGFQLPNASKNPAMSWDGRYISFDYSFNKVMLRDRQNQLTTNVTDDGDSATFDSGVSSSLSPDGQYAAFQSCGSPAGTVLVNLQTNQRIALPGSVSGVFATLCAAGIPLERRPVISNQGEYTAYYIYPNGTEVQCVYKKSTSNVVCLPYRIASPAFSTSGANALLAFESPDGFTSADTNFGDDIYVGQLSANPPTATPTATNTSTRIFPTDPFTLTPVQTRSTTPIATSTRTITPTSTATPTRTATPTATLTRSATPLATATPTRSSTPSPSPTRSSTPTATRTVTASPTRTPTLTPTGTVTAPHPDTIGIFRRSSSTFFLRNSNTTGIADSSLTFGASTDFPITGDWNGDGIDTPGVYRPTTGQFFLTDSTTNPAALNYSLVLGVPNDQPIVGDWDGDGKDGVGVFRPSNGLIYLKNSLTTGFADFAMVLGSPGDVGLAGDWNGDGKDSPGVYRPSNQQFYLTNSICNCSVFADAQLGLGIAGDTPFIGDWDDDGKSGIGVYRQSNGLTYIKNALTTGFADASFVFGNANDYPLAGYWVRVSPPPASEPASTFQP